MIRQALSVLAIGILSLPVVASSDDDDDFDEAEEYSEPEQAQVDVSVDGAFPGASVTFETFRGGLAPYGDWMTVGAYGHVWHPHVAPGWRPYYYGHWVWSDEGWLWVSDEPWGWGPYHYGRWAYDAYVGWLWVPGYQWAPAWVSWRFGAAAVGWAPLAPGFSIYVGSYPAIYSSWTFVPSGSFVGAPVHRVAYAPAHVPSVFHGTQPAPPRAAIGGLRAPAWGGPARGFVEQRVGHPIAPARILPVGSPSLAAAGPRAGGIPVYRPEGPRAVAPGGFRPGWGSPARPGGNPPGRSFAPGNQGPAHVPHFAPSPLPSAAGSARPPPASPRGGGYLPPPAAGGGRMLPPSHGSLGGAAPHGPDPGRGGGGFMPPPPRPSGAMPPPPGHRR